MKHNEAVTMCGGILEEWLEALHARHVASYRPKEFTHALQALSVRYVERRKELGARSPLDSAGKRAAFAAFYAPLHFLTVSEILDRVADNVRPASIADLGCGTGVCGAAWALRHRSDPDAPRVSVSGIDDHQWAVDEARWNLKTLRVDGRISRGDFTAAKDLSTADAVILGWAVNELTADARAGFLPKLLAFAAERGPVLIIEPLSHAVSPWWSEWAAAFAAIGGRADEWKFRVDQPQMLKELGHRAGFRRDVLGARSLWAASKASSEKR